MKAFIGFLVLLFFTTCKETVPFTKEVLIEGSVIVEGTDFPLQNLRIEVYLEEELIDTLYTDNDGRFMYRIRKDRARYFSLDFEVPEDYSSGETIINGIVENDSEVWIDEDRYSFLQSMAPQSKIHVVMHNAHKFSNYNLGICSDLNGLNSGNELRFNPNDSIVEGSLSIHGNRKDELVITYYKLDLKDENTLWQEMHKSIFEVKHQAWTADTVYLQF